MKIELIINTSPILALIAGIGNLDFLKIFFKKVYVPLEVCNEIKAGKNKFGINVFNNDNWLIKLKMNTAINLLLRNSLDVGEASVIQCAIDKKINTVCIDEAKGRRIARISGLNVTGSLGILMYAKKRGLIYSLQRLLTK